MERFLAWVLQHDDIRDMTIIPRMKGVYHYAHVSLFPRTLFVIMFTIYNRSIIKHKEQTVEHGV